MNPLYRRTVLAALLCVTLLQGTALAQRGPAPHTGSGDVSPRPVISQHGFGPPNHQGPPPPPWALRPGELEGLRLTDAQHDKFDALRETGRRTMIRAEAEARIAELDLEGLIEQDAPNAMEIDAAIERLGALRLSLHKAMVTEALGVRAVLTADQRSRLRKRAVERGQERERR